MSFSWAIMIAAVPVIGLLLLGYILKRKGAEMRPAFRDPLLRPAGESCREEVDRLMDCALNWVIVLVSPIFLAVSAHYAHLDLLGYWIYFGVSLIVTLVATTRLWHLADEVRNCRLGSDGERAVGQEINQCLEFDAKVYHDLQFDGFNIDHVIIAPSGIYAVETKARRKGRNKDSHRVTYDGSKLIFPQGVTSCLGLEQVTRNAKTLAVWLNAAVGQSFWVEPILTMPGWLIDGQGAGSVHVLNPKQIVDFVKTNKTSTPLSRELIERISYQVAQKSFIS